MDLGALLLLFFIVVSLQPLVQQRALDLMRLFPQPLRKTPSVEYLPFRHEPTAPPK